MTEIQTDTITISWEEGVCVAYSQNYPVIGVGDTEEEARKSLSQCIDSYVYLVDEWGDPNDAYIESTKDVLNA